MTYFPYLTDGKPIDHRLCLELEAAGVPAVRGSCATWGEHIWHIEGRLGHFIFRRQVPRYYWMVSGLMPLDLAERLYAEPGGKDARPGGDCTAPPPASQAIWIEPDGREGLADWDAQFKQLETLRTSSLYESLLARRHRCYCQRTENARPFLWLWHIDTPEALCLFAQYARQVTIGVSELDALYRGRHL